MVLCILGESPTEGKYLLITWYGRQGLSDANATYHQWYWPWLLKVTLARFLHCEATSFPFAYSILQKRVTKSILNSRRGKLRNSSRMENIYTYHFFHSFFIMKKRDSDMTASSKDRHYLIIYLSKEKFCLLNTLTYQYQDTKDPCSKLDYSVLFCSHLFHSKNIIECQLQQHSVQLLVLVLNFFYLPENLILEWSILLYLNIEISMTDKLLLNDKIIIIILLINFILVNNS